MSMNSHSSHHQQQHPHQAHPHHQHMHQSHHHQSHLEDEEDLPLPSFVEIFGESSSLGSSALKKKKRTGAGGRAESLGEESTGRWTPDEHRLFLEGIMLYGKDWKKMQPLIKTRTLVQIRTHAQKVFKKIGLKKMNAIKRKEPTERLNEKEPQPQQAQSNHLPKSGADELDDLDDDELEQIGLTVEGVDESMLAALTTEQQQQLALQQQAVHNHYAQITSNETKHELRGTHESANAHIQSQLYHHHLQERQQHHQNQHVSQAHPEYPGGGRSIQPQDRS